MTVEIQVHSAHMPAVLATEVTLKSLPGKACSGFARNDAGEVLVSDGWVKAETENPRFLEFAIRQQGYAKDFRLEVRP
jgi:hypothetical protein